MKDASIARRSQLMNAARVVICITVWRAQAGQQLFQAELDVGNLQPTDTAMVEPIRHCAR
jgi:hypothetical protein